MSDIHGQRMIADRYLLSDRLGSGGMGTVWRATDRLLGRAVAVKEIHVQADGGEELARRSRRARREARSLARISHPHVVDIYDLLHHEGRLWMVMELVDGPSLAEHVAAAGPMPPHRVAEIGLQLLAALEAVHALGVLHRDVKPANILLRRDSDIVLCDFGIAALADSASLTKAGGLVGSLEFIAPERLDGRPVGPPSDLFSVGSTLCALLSGASPFARPEAAAVLYAVSHEQPYVPDSAGPLRPLLEALLRKDPGGRPSTGAAVDMLRPLAVGAGRPPTRAFGPPPPPLSPPPPPGGRAPRRLGLPRWALLPSALVLAAALTAGTLTVRALVDSGSGASSGDDGKPSPSASQPVPFTAPTPVDAVMPAPGQNRYRVFSRTSYVQVTGSDESPFRKWDFGPSARKDWYSTFAPQTDGRKRIDAVMPVPGEEGAYWVFSGPRYFRIHTGNGEFDNNDVKGSGPLTDWKEAFDGLAGFQDGIDAVMPVPGNPQQFWVFSEDTYVRTELYDEGPQGWAEFGPLKLDNWTGTFAKTKAQGFSRKIDAVMPVPDESAEYWVFSGTHYIKIHLDSANNYADLLLQSPRRFPG